MLSNEVLKEVKKMLLYILVMVAVMILIFALCGYFNFQVILGGLLGGAVAFLNFFFLARAVEKSVSGEGSPKGAMASSYAIRIMCIAAVVVFSIKSPYINYLAMIIPLVFPRIAIMISKLLKKKVK